MSFDEKVLNSCERAVFSLRNLFKQNGYEQYKVSKFEEYDLYMRNKNFLVSENVLTFTDTNGKLMALKPDVTLSIIKNTKDDEPTKKVYYNELVYRPSDENGFREITQTGLECISNKGEDNTSEVITLALKSLETISTRYLLNIAHNGFLLGAFNKAGLDKSCIKKLMLSLSKRDASAIISICANESVPTSVKDVLVALCDIYKPLSSALESLEKLILNDEMRLAFDELKSLKVSLENQNLLKNVYIDFSIDNDTNYYNGIVFNGFINDLPKSILAGGRYDNLVKRMGKEKWAIGFAVYLDLLERIDEDEKDDDEYINVALPKGRLGEKAYEMFEKSGFECPAIYDKGRKLIFENDKTKVRYFWVKPSDVAIYVEKGAADIGIVGKDILLEQNSDVYEMLDLKMGKCRMAVAAKKDFVDNRDKTLVVATKFPNIARSYYNSISRQIDIIKLNGSIEIAPLLSLSDVIVDIVETGKTLLENNLEPKETIVQISARLISNKSSYKFKNEKITKMRDKIAQLINNED